MTERPPVIVDREAGERFLFVVDKGRELFAGSALFDVKKEVTAQDVELIGKFYRAVAPTNLDNPWRLVPSERAVERGEIADPSTFANWEAAGGFQEHFQLTTKAAVFITEALKKHLRPLDTVADGRARSAIADLRYCNPQLLAAAAGLHDIGRTVTHIFYTTELIGKRVLRRIGIREDVQKLLTDESVMLTPLGRSMDEAIAGLPAGSVVVRLADEFGKREPGTNRTRQLADFDAAKQAAWGDAYVKRPPSGRISDEKMRRNMILHNANVPRYFEAIKKYVGRVCTLSLEDMLRSLAHELSPLLVDQ